MKKKNLLQRLLSPEPTAMGNAALDLYRPPSPEVMEKVLLTGDLASLTPSQRLSYYESVCRALRLNPLTKPFEYITLNGRLTLYARKDCTDQLRRTYDISLHILGREITSDGIAIVTAQAKMQNGRQDEAIGSVSLPNTGEARANALMKAETKAKRRVTLSICGLGMFDESEMDSASSFQQDGDQATAQDKVAAATANRLVNKEPEITEVTSENCGEVVCHIGKAEGELLNKKVKDIHPRLLTWLQKRFGPGEETPRWGNPPSEKDVRLKEAVDLELRKLE